jgi:hypothetical protein
MFDQLDFPSSSPMFHPLLPYDRINHRFMEFGMHQSIDAVLFGEAFQLANAMLPCAADEIAGDPYIKRPVPLAGQNVDTWLLHWGSTERIVWPPAFAGVTTVGRG